MRDVELVVFDLGRVLLRIADDWAHAAALSSVALPEQLSGDISAADTRRQGPELEVLFAGFEAGRVAIEDFFAAAGPMLGLEPAAARRLFDGWLIEPMPGLANFFDRLDEAQARRIREGGAELLTACLSNTNAAHWEHLAGATGHPAALGLDRLDFPLGSQLIGFAKPEPAAYAAVEAAAGVDGEAVVFFDDLEANVAAAREHGWRAYLVPKSDDALPGVSETLVELGVFEA